MSSLDCADVHKRTLQKKREKKPHCVFSQKLYIFGFQQGNDRNRQNPASMTMEEGKGRHLVYVKAVHAGLSTALFLCYTRTSVVSSHIVYSIVS